MGFQKNDYQIQKKGISLSQAYAVVKNITINGEHVKAEFAINVSRNNALNCEPIDVKTISLKYDRAKDLLPQIYAAAKTDKTVKDFEIGEDGKPHIVDKTIKAPFSDWDDDIIAPAENAE